MAEKTATTNQSDGRTTTARVVDLKKGTIKNGVNTSHKPNFQYHATFKLDNQGDKLILVLALPSTLKARPALILSGSVDSNSVESS